MPELRMNDERLAAALADLGTHVAYPATPDLRPRVLERIAKPQAVPWWRQLASPRHGLAPALASLALVLVAVLVFSPEARSAATDILRLRGVEIFRANLYPGIAANPYLAFSTVATESGDIVFAWTGDSNFQARESRKLTVT